MKAVLVGHGRMGRLLEKMIEEREGMEVAGIVDIGYHERISDIKNEFDVIIDYSHPDNLDKIYEYEINEAKPLVIATTGYTSEQISQIEEIAKTAPVVYTANFSLGITVMEHILEETAPILKDSFDIEIIEKHHNKKLDAPSGTAKMLADAMNKDGEFNYIYGRSGETKRGKEIGIHAVRGGNIAGEHSVIFAGEDEILEIRHSAGSRKIFAAGAIKAANFILKRKNGLYSMGDVLFGR